MSENEKKPEIRFAGFTDALPAGRQVGNSVSSIIDVLQNNALSRADLSDEQGSVMNVHYGDILVRFGEVLDVSSEKIPYIVDDAIAKKYSSSELQNVDIIIADAAEDETVGKFIEIANLQGEKVLAGLHTIPVRARLEFSCGYLGYYLNSNSYHDQLLPLMQGTKVSSISKSAIQDTLIIFPKSAEEQQRIGDYFRNLDHLITLHQCKHFKLKSIQKYFKIYIFRQRSCSEMIFKTEAEFEEAVIDRLVDAGWVNHSTGQPEILRYKTEKELIKNWADILFENNNEIDRLNDVPLTE